MRRLQTVKITGNEVLAKDVYSENGVIVITAGTRLKKEYIKKLSDLKIRDIFVEDEISKEIKEESITESVISDSCGKTIKNIMESFSYAPVDRLKEVTEKAESIMIEILSEGEVLYNVSNVRNYDRSLSDHCMNVAALSILVALNSGFPRKKVKEIAIGALLHDIGFLEINADYKNLKPEDMEGALKSEIKRHVVYGYLNVERQEWLTKTSKEIILYHHERLDGSGYPSKLKDDAISQEVRLVAICDAFDCMIYGNLTKRLKVYEAMEYIMGNAGTKFDMKLAKKFSESIAVYPTGTIVITNTGDTCIVTGQNNGCPTRPVLKKLDVESDGEKKIKDEIIDLAEELTVFIVDTEENYGV